MTAPKAREMSLARRNRADVSTSPRSAIGARVLHGEGMAAVGAGGVTTTTLYQYRATSSAEEVHVTQTTVHPAPSAMPSSDSRTAAPESRGGARAASRFHFVSDTRAPSELQRLEKETLRRRLEFKEKVREMEYRIAGWTARLANETVERDREWDDLVQRATGRPLEEAMERIMGRIERKFVSPVASVQTADDDSSKDKDIHVPYQKILLELDSKITRLDTALLEHVHKSTYDARVNHMDSIRTKLRDEAYPLLRLEAAKADKREGGMVRTYEGIAASAAHAMAEENAARVADLKLLGAEVEREMRDKTIRNEARIEEFLEEIRRIRESLDEEKKERQISDERVLEQIIRTREVLQRTFLESLGES